MARCEWCDTTKIKPKHLAEVDGMRVCVTCLDIHADTLHADARIIEREAEDLRRAGA